MSNKNFSKINYQVVDNDYDNYDDEQFFDDEEQFYEDEIQEEPEYYPEEVEVSIPAEEEIVYAAEPRDSWDEDEITTTTPTLIERADSKANTETAKCDAAKGEDLSAKLNELLAWCEYMGIGIDEIPGTFQEKYEEMVWNKSVESKKLAQEIALREEAERLEREAKGAANLVLVEKKRKAAEDERRAANKNCPNERQVAGRSC